MSEEDSRLSRLPENLGATECRELVKLSRIASEPLRSGDCIDWAEKVAVPLIKILGQRLEGALNRIESRGDPDY